MFFLVCHAEANPDWYIPAVERQFAYLFEVDRRSVWHGPLFRFFVVERQGGHWLMQENFTFQSSFLSSQRLTEFTFRTIYCIFVSFCILSSNIESTSHKHLGSVKLSDIWKESFLYNHWGITSFKKQASASFLRRLELTEQSVSGHKGGMKSPPSHCSCFMHHCSSATSTNIKSPSVNFLSSAYYWHRHIFMVLHRGSS